MLRPLNADIEADKVEAQQRVKRLATIFGDPDLYRWSLLLLFCHKRKITMEEMLYSKKRDAAKNRSKFWKELYDTDTNKTKHLTKQEHLAQMFNASQQAVSKALKSRR